MTPHKKTDLAITDSGDLIVIPEWVNDYKINGEDHPLKGRAGDLLLSNEIHHIVTHGNLVTNQDIESSLKSTQNPDSRYQESTQTLFETIFSQDGDDIIDDAIRSFIQEVIVRLRTNSPDFKFHTAIGANLEDLIGEWNTETVGNHGLESIVRQLETIKGMTITYKDAIPISNKKITFVIRIQGSNRQTISLKIDFDFEEGIVIRGEVIS